MSTLGADDPDLPKIGIHAPPKISDASGQYIVSESQRDTKPPKKEDEYDPSLSIVYRDSTRIDLYLIAYVAIGITVYVFCYYLVSTSGKCFLSNYNHYRRTSTFIDHTMLFFGGLVSILALSIACWIDTKDSRGMGSLTLTLFLLINLTLVFFYMNLMYRLEMVSKGSYHTGNGTGYLVISIFLTAILFARMIRKNVMSGLLCLIPIGWYVYVLYNWLYDNHRH